MPVSRGNSIGFFRVYKIGEFPGEPIWLENGNIPFTGYHQICIVTDFHLEEYSMNVSRDQYIFILRCLWLAAAGGRIGMVTQQSWMFLRSYADLRAVEEDKAREFGKASVKDKCEY